jgi:hypothetical protein
MGARNSTCNVPNSLDTFCGGRGEGEALRREGEVCLWELVVMGLDCGYTN